MMHGVEDDPSTRKYRERELYTIPITSSWFRWDDIHDFERRSLPEFFEGGSYSRSPRVYKEYRDFIINKYRENPSRRLTFTDVRKSLVGDVCTVRKVFLFLENWGLINFGASDGKQQLQQHPEDGGPVVMVEEGPAAGVRVVPSLSSYTAFASPTLAGGEGLFRLPSLTSYSDVFGEWKSSGDLICGFCGGHFCSELNESLKGGITICSKCSSKGDSGNEKSEEDLMLNNQTDIKDHSFAAWTDAETLLLLEAVLKHGDDWDLIAQHVRTKNKIDCISRLVHLPFGEHLLGTASMESSNLNIVTLLEECKSSLHVLNDNPSVFTEIDGDEQVEIIKTEGEERDGQKHPLNKKCFPPFIDTTDSFMKQAASLTTVCGAHVSTAATDAAIRALCQENPCAKLAFETNEDKVAIALSPPHANEFKSDFKFEDDEVKRSKHPDFVPTKDFGVTTFQLRAAIASSLAAAAARAKLIADEEERQMELLISSIIEAQIRKLQHKMKHLEEAGVLMEKELSHVQQAKEKSMEEWVGVLKNLFNAGIPRWRDQAFSKAFLHSLPL